MIACCAGIFQRLDRRPGDALQRRVLARIPISMPSRLPEAKHRGPGESRVAIYWQRLQQVFELRRANIDLVILPRADRSPRRAAGALDRRTALLRQTDAAAGKVVHAVEAVRDSDPANWASRTAAGLS